MALSEEGTPEITVSTFGKRGRRKKRKKRQIPRGFAQGKIRKSLNPKVSTNRTILLVVEI